MSRGSWVFIYTFSLIGFFIASAFTGYMLLFHFTGSKDISCWGGVIEDCSRKFYEDEMFPINASAAFTLLFSLIVLIYLAKKKIITPVKNRAQKFVVFIGSGILLADALSIILTYYHGIDFFCGAPFVGHYGGGNCDLNATQDFYFAFISHFALITGLLGLLYINISRQQQLKAE